LERSGKFVRQQRFVMPANYQKPKNYRAQNIAKADNEKPSIIRPDRMAALILFSGITTRPWTSLSLGEQGVS
jgi:hypothetical protein